MSSITTPPARGLWKRWWFWPPVALLIAFATLLLVCRHYHVYSLNGWRVYQAMAAECHPAWRDYNFGRVVAGDSVDDVIARTHPELVERKGRWVVLHYQKNGLHGLHFTGLSAVACDGRMVQASVWSCTYDRLFFDEMSEQQCLEFEGRPKNDLRRFGIAPVYR